MTQIDPPSLPYNQFSCRVNYEGKTVTHGANLLEYFLFFFFFFRSFFLFFSSPFTYLHILSLAAGEVCLVKSNNPKIKKSDVFLLFEKRDLRILKIFFIYVCDLVGREESSLPLSDSCDIVILCINVLLWIFIDEACRYYYILLYYIHTILLCIHYILLHITILLHTRRSFDCQNNI